MAAAAVEAGGGSGNVGEEADAGVGALSVGTFVNGDFKPFIHHSYAETSVEEASAAAVRARTEEDAQIAAAMLASVAESGPPLATGAVAGGSGGGGGGGAHLPAGFLQPPPRGSDGVGVVSSIPVGLAHGAGVPAPGAGAGAGAEAGAAPTTQEHAGLAAGVGSRGTGAVDHDADYALAVVLQVQNPKP